MMANGKSTTRSEHEVTPAITRAKRRVVLEDTEDDGQHDLRVSENRQSSQPDESASEVPETLQASQSSTYDRPSSPEPDDDEETTARTAGRHKVRDEARDLPHTCNVDVRISCSILFVHLSCM